MREKDAVTGKLDWLDKLDAEHRAQCIEDLNIRHAVGLHLLSDLNPHYWPDVYESDVREVEGTKYIRVHDVEGRILAIYRQVGELKIEKMDDCPIEILVD
jgi:hypothetical protein